MTNKKAQIDVERSRRVENQQLLAKYLSDTMEKEELIEWIVLNLEDDEIEAQLDIFLTTEEEVAFESEDLAEPTEGLKISKKQAAYREVNIPRDWHQGWLEPLLDAMNETFDAITFLSGELQSILPDLSEQDKSLGVEEVIKKTNRLTAEYYQDLADTFDYLDVSPGHIGEGSKKTAQVQAEPGSVSHGTLRTEDLIETFMFTLSQLDPAAYDAAVEEYELFDTMEGQSKEEFDGWFLNEYLFDKLNEYSPPGHYFGAHPGDGSDFGWWPVEEEF